MKLAICIMTILLTIMLPSPLNNLAAGRNILLQTQTQDLLLVAWNSADTNQPIQISGNVTKITKSCVSIRIDDKPNIIDINILLKKEFKPPVVLVGQTIDVVGIVERCGLQVSNETRNPILKHTFIAITLKDASFKIRK